MTDNQTPTPTGSTYFSGSQPLPNNNTATFDYLGAAQNMATSPLPNFQTQANLQSTSPQVESWPKFTGVWDPSNLRASMNAIDDATKAATGIDYKWEISNALSNALTEAEKSVNQVSPSGAPVQGSEDEVGVDPNVQWPILPNPNQQPSNLTNTETASGSANKSAINNMLGRLNNKNINAY